MTETDNDKVRKALSEPLVCDSVSCQRQATRMWPMGEATSFHCWLDSITMMFAGPVKMFDNQPPVEPINHVMRGCEEEDARQRDLFMQYLNEGNAALLTQQEAVLANLSQDIFEGLTLLAKAMDMRDTLRTDRQAVPEDVSQAAQTFRDQEKRVLELMKKFCEVYIEGAGTGTPQ